MKDKEIESESLMVQAGKYLVGQMAEMNAETFEMTLENFSVGGEVKGDYKIEIYKIPSN